MMWNRAVQFLQHDGRGPEPGRRSPTRVRLRVRGRAHGVRGKVQASDPVLDEDAHRGARPDARALGGAAPQSNPVEKVPREQQRRRPRLPRRVRRRERRAELSGREVGGRRGGGVERARARVGRPIESARDTRGRRTSSSTSASISSRVSARDDPISGASSVDAVAIVDSRGPRVKPRVGNRAASARGATARSAKSATSVAR